MEMTGKRKFQQYWKTKKFLIRAQSQKHICGGLQKRGRSRSLSQRETKNQYCLSEETFGDGSFGAIVRRRVEKIQGHRRAAHGASIHGWPLAGAEAQDRPVCQRGHARPSGLGRPQFGLTEKIWGLKRRRPGGGLSVPGLRGS